MPETTSVTAFLLSAANLLSWICLGVLMLLFYYDREKERINHRIKETNIDTHLERLLSEIEQVSVTQTKNVMKSELLNAAVALLSMTGTRYASRRVTFGEEWMPHPAEVTDEDIIDAMQVVLKTAHELKDEFALATLCSKEDLEALGYVTHKKG